MDQFIQLVIVLTVKSMQLAQVGQSINIHKHLLFLFTDLVSLEDGTIRLWQTDPTKSYGLWQK